MSDRLNVKEELQNLPTWAKLVLAIGTLIIVIKWFPILDLINLFLYVVVIPLGFLTALGFVSSEAANSFMSTCNMVSEKLKDAANQAREPQPAPANQATDEERDR